MYKISAPIALSTISDTNPEKSLKKYLEYFREGRIERVFICCLSPVYSEKCEVFTHSDKLKNAIRFFKDSGMEAGVWIGGFGHGVLLTHEHDNPLKRNYQMQASVTGEEFGYAYCPLDENFTDDYMKAVKKIASFEPDLIMIDDDFRLNGRWNHYMGCFCPLHLKEYYRLIGEEIPRDEIEKRAFSGGKNKYRSAYMEMLKKTLLDFALRFRAAVDEVNPDIRVGSCVPPSNWDLAGTDAVEIAKAFAGNGKPFMRPFGAPYYDKYTLIDAIEIQRMQMSWKNTIDSNVEAFAEGDMYPRPRYNVPSKSLELFDLALLCDGGADGILKYMFDYDLKVGYEEGYIQRHIENLEMMECIRSIFKDKKCTGVSVFSAVHKIKDWVFPENPEKDIVRKLEVAAKSYASDILSKNSIPVCYESNGYPIAVFGESARHIPFDMLSNGAVLDSTAAMILKQRGIDTGITDIKKMSGNDGEYYAAADDTIRNLNVKINELTCADEARVLSFILPHRTPGAYIYKNADGIEFFVLACDFQASECDANYFNNYYRQEQIIAAIEQIGGKKLPAVCMKNPNLYIMTSANENSMGVLLMNIFPDEIKKPVIALDKEYKNIRFINCDGKMKGDKVYLTQLPSYGFGVFEVGVC